MASRSNSNRNLIESSSSHKIRPTPVTVSGVSFASTIWLIATFMLSAGLVIAGAFPYWTSRTSPPTSLQAINVHSGLYYMCYTPGLGQDSTVQQICSLYVYPEFIPSNRTNLARIETSDIVYLFTGSLSYGLGTGLLMISLIFGIVAYCKPRIKGQSMYLVAFVIQLFACIFLIAGLVLWPLMYHSNFARQFCGLQSDYYIRGKCQVGWCTQVAMVIVSLTFYLPPLAIFSMNVSDGLRAYRCC